MPAPNWQGMKILQAPTRTAAILAQLLERLDASRQPVDAHQYRTVAARLAEMLGDTDIDWQPLLEQSPAAAALYENLHYGDAGLCRSPLDEAMRAEMADKIVEATEKLLAKKLTAAEHAKLVDKYLTKVVLN